MDGSLAVNGTAGLMAALIKEARANQNLLVAVVKKTQEVEKMQGEAVLRLIDSASVAVPSGIDVYA